MEKKYLFYHTGLGFAVGIVSFLIIIFIVAQLFSTVFEHPLLKLLSIAAGAVAIIGLSFYADKWAQQRRWRKK